MTNFDRTVPGGAAAWMDSRSANMTAFCEPILKDVKHARISEKQDSVSLIHSDSKIPFDPASVTAHTNAAKDLLSTPYLKPREEDGVELVDANGTPLADEVPLPYHLIEAFVAKVEQQKVVAPSKAAAISNSAEAAWRAAQGDAVNPAAANLENAFAVDAFTLKEGAPTNMS